MSDPMDIQNLAAAATEQLKEVLSQDIVVQQQARIEELEAKLEKAEQMLQREIRRVQKIQADFSPPHKVGLNHVEEEYKLMLAELKGEHHE